MSNLLLNSRPLVIIPELAALIGLNESIILQQIHYWLKVNEKADRNYHEGSYWTYNSISEWQEQFPFWSQSTIRRTLDRLEDKKLIITGIFNKAKFDRTKWYTIDYDELYSLEYQRSAQNGQMHIPKLSKPIPETNSDMGDDDFQGYNSSFREHITDFASPTRNKKGLS